jgi:hypothetical protein
VIRRLIIPLLFVCLSASRAEARFEHSAAVARSRASGGALVSLVDNASAVFVNPAGLVLAGRLAAYADYDEPPLAGGARESRLAGAARISRIYAGLGWYRFAGAGETDDLFLAGVACRLLEESQGSLVSVGANASLGRVSHEDGMACPAALGVGCPSARSSAGITGDLGVLVRPLPVISFAYSVGNVFGADLDRLAGQTPWSRMQRWGVSYFWEDRFSFSFAQEMGSGRSTLHYGLIVKTAVPVEILMGFSDGHPTGGVRWRGPRFSAVVGFSADDGGRVIWTAGCEMRTRRGRMGEEL